MATTEASPWYWELDGILQELEGNKGVLQVRRQSTSMAWCWLRDGEVVRPRYPFVEELNKLAHREVEMYRFSLLCSQDGLKQRLSPFKDQLLHLLEFKASNVARPPPCIPSA